MRRDWGHPPVPWYARRRERRPPSLQTLETWRSLWDRLGTLYGAPSLVAAENHAEAAHAPAIDRSGLGLWDRGEPVREKEPTLPDPDAKTLQEIADELGVTREYVRQIEANAIRHLRVVLRALLHGSPRDLELALDQAKQARAKRIASEATGARIRQEKKAAAARGAAA